MDFGPIALDADTEALVDDVCALLCELVTDELLEREASSGDGVDVELHRELGRRGWLTPMRPPQEGGIAATTLQAALIYRELVEHDVPLIAYGTTMNVEPVVRRWAPEPLRSEVLAGIASGEIRICLGYTEPDAGSDLAGIKTRATPNGDGWSITGQKMFSTAAHLCRYAFVVTKTNADAPTHRSLTTFLVDLTSPGIEVRAIRTLGGERTNMVFYDDVHVPDAHRMGPLDEGWAVVSEPLVAEHGRAPTDEAGLLATLTSPGAIFARELRRALDAAAGWAHSPGPDDRRPIDDPRVRDRLHRLHLDCEIATVAPGPMGKVYGAEALIRGASELLDLVGAAALVEGPNRLQAIERAHRYAQGTAIHGGTTDIHRNLIAEHELGLPRSRPRRSS